MSLQKYSNSLSCNNIFEEPSPEDSDEVAGCRNCRRKSRQTGRDFREQGRNPTGVRQVSRTEGDS
jgi:hypothetical protein